MGKDSRNRLCHTSCCFQPSVHCPPSPPPPSPAVECQREPAGMPRAVCPPPAAPRKLPSVGCRLRVKHFMSVFSFTLYQYSMKLYKIFLPISQMRSWDSEWLRNWPENTEPLSGRFASPPSAVLLEIDPPVTAGFSRFPSQAKEKFRDSEVSGKRKVSVLL